MLRNFRDGEIGCIIVCIPVHGQFKAKKWYMDIMKMNTVMEKLNFKLWKD